jgi:hypothetical protein
MQIELTEEEFELICMAVDNAAHTLGEASTQEDEEDAMIDNKYYLLYIELQKKFPAPGPFRLRNEE